MNGQKKSVQAAMKVNRPSIAAAGRAAGTPTVQKVRIMVGAVDARGLDQLVGDHVDEVLRHQEHAERGDQVGHDDRADLPVQPSWRIRMYSGTTPSWVGTASVATTKTMQPVAAAEAQLRERPAGEGREDHDRDRDDARRR